MNVDEVVDYWLQLAEDDWPIANRLVGSGDYHYALFIGHLYLEKLLKALVVQATNAQESQLNSSRRTRWFKHISRAACSVCQDYQL